MPYTIKKEGSQHCVYKKDTNEKVKCHSSAKEAQAHLGALESNVQETMAEIERIVLEKGGPVLLGIAVTNRPALPLPPMRIVDIDGKRYIKTPFLRAGVFEDPRYGRLIFNQAVFDAMLKNFENGASYFGVSLDLRHKPELGALAWYSKDHGGFIKKEYDPEYGTLLVGYGVPTGQDAIELIEKGKYIYASVDFHPNYKNPLVKKLSTDDLVELADTDLVSLEEIMSDVTIAQAELDALKEQAKKAEQVEDLEAKLAELESQVAKEVEEKEAVQEEAEELEEKVTKLEADLKSYRKEEDDTDVPEAVRVQLEQQNEEINRLKKEALASRVDALIEKAKARRDEEGKGHSPILLEIARSAMLGETIEAGEEKVIRLESVDPASLASYSRKAWELLLEVLPGQVQFETKTETSEPTENPLNADKTYGKDVIDAFWADM
ncbi:hypothetical protein GF395_04400 [Candidatus Uhrbacteria bacterium]|nr:hypothetical protein [Candidatus Uhrbacteria bacterium]